jgi:serine/threonine protein phosphatase 1
LDTLRRLATIKNCHSVWAVASLHAEQQRLDAVHRVLYESFQAGDAIVYLGNMIGRGPMVRQSVDALLAFRRELIAQPAVFAGDLIYLRGVQEELFDKLLQLQFSQSPQDIAEWMLRNGLASTLQAYGSSASELTAVAQLPATQISRYTAKLREAIRAAPGHAAFYSSLKRAAALDTGSLLFVHAGLDPYRPLAAQTDAFWWGNTAFMQMNQPYQGFERVVTGWHPEHRGVFEAAYYTLFDAGAGFGGKLLLGQFSPRGNLLQVFEA